MDNEELIRRAELKHYLTPDELTLPDVQREKLLLQRKMVDSGLLRESDLALNDDVICKSAKGAATKRNGFTFFSDEDWKVKLLVILVMSASVVLTLLRDD
jgi:hypothetical protein